MGTAQAESKLGNIVPVSHYRKAQTLNYPKLPKEILSRIAGGKTRKSATSTVDASLSKDWALANIDFFKVFTPLVQPIVSETVSCSNAVIVAVIDTGMDYTHPELKDSLWVNKGESGAWEPPASLKQLGFTCRDKSCNGIDDDGNGFIDDVVGWDFVHDVPLPYDTHGHGTHIAGIIAGASANGIGTSGVCPRVTIMPLKYYDNSGVGYNNLTNTVRAIRYAVRAGAHIINYSGGGSDPAPSEKAAILEAQQKGVLFVAAAGNDGRSNDRIPYYPASYQLDNIVGVASVNRDNILLPSSNYGKSVHLAAPGLMILSALPAGKFGTMSGTSQATAFATGAAALLASQMDGQDPREHYGKIKSWLYRGAKPMKNNEKKVMVSGGLLSVSLALKEQRKDLKPKAVASRPEIALRPGGLIKKIRTTK